MSAFAGFFGAHYVIVGADTLVSYPYQEGDTQLRPARFSNRTHVLPQYKSLFAWTEHPALGVAFFRAASQTVADCMDVATLTRIPIQDVLQSVFEEETFAANGRLYLYGWHEERQSFQGYFLPINAKGKAARWQELLPFDKGGICVSSGIPSLVKQATSALPDEYTAADLVQELLFCQKEAESRLPLSEQNGTGGQIVLTYLQMNDGLFSATQQVTYTFPDYEQQCQQALANVREMMNGTGLVKSIGTMGGKQSQN